MDDHKYLFKVVLVGNAGVGLFCNLTFLSYFLFRQDVSGPEIYSGSCLKIFLLAKVV